MLWKTQIQPTKDQTAVDAIRNTKKNITELQIILRTGII